MDPKDLVCPVDRWIDFWAPNLKRTKIEQEKTEETERRERNFNRRKQR